MTVGSLTLTPAFANGTHEYTMSTSNATNKVTAVLKDSIDVLEIKVNGTAIDNRTSAQWSEGSNTLTVKCTDSDTSESVTYTVTVTYTP